MRTTFTVIGTLVAILGTIWFLQGINVLPGSFMTGQMKWAIYGSIAFVVGVVTIVVARRMKR